MTPNNEFAVQCNQVLNSIVLFIDNEIEDSAKFNAVSIRLFFQSANRYASGINECLNWGNINLLILKK